jgi:hypothetical protein
MEKGGRERSLKNATSRTSEVATACCTSVKFGSAGFTEHFLISIQLSVAAGMLAGAWCARSVRLDIFNESPTRLAIVGITAGFDAIVRVGWQLALDHLQ